jgi:outer membrane immunogenic protein
MANQCRSISVVSSCWFPFATEQVMKRILLTTAGCAALLLAVQAASAADLSRRTYHPPAPAPAPVQTSMFDWTGFYVGLNAGYGWGRSSYDFGAPPTYSFDTSGALIGGTAGYNLQFGPTVVGVEGDLDWSGMRDSGGCAGAICTTRNTWLGTTRARLGYAGDRFMPYLTGGAAFGNIKATTPGGSDSTTKVGWTAGGGVEVKVTPSVSAKLEYLYVDLGTFSCGAACGGTPTADVDFHSNVVRTGLNYRF